MTKFVLPLTVAMCIALAPAAFAQTMAPQGGNMSNTTTSSDKMTKPDTMGKPDAMKKDDAMGKTDGMKKDDAMSKDGMKKDGMSK